MYTQVWTECGNELFVQVILTGNSEGDSLGFLGYCPQENVLWPNLSVREHLEVFAAIKGLKKGDATVTITQYVGGDTPVLFWGCV